MSGWCEYRQLFWHFKGIYEKLLQHFALECNDPDRIKNFNETRDLKTP